MKIEIDVDIPEGYEATGAYFIPTPDATWLGMDGQAHGKDGTCKSPICFTGMTQPRIILRKKKCNVIAWVPDDNGKFCQEHENSWLLCGHPNCIRLRYRREVREE